MKILKKDSDIKGTVKTGWIMKAPMENYIFEDRFEALIKKQYSTIGHPGKKAYICSPLRADSVGGLMLNIRIAKAYMYYAAVKMDLPARAPHAFLPMLFNDMIPSEREAALEFGLKILEMSDALLLCGNRISQGMLGEIEYAVFSGKEIRVFEKGVFDEIIDMAPKLRHGDMRKIIFDADNPFMSLSGPDVFAGNWDWVTGGGT